MKKFTTLFLVLGCLIGFNSSALATKYYVDLLNGNDGNSGADWNNARLTLASAATLGANWDSILVKGNTWTTNTTFAFPASRKYFGSCAGNEIFPSQRPMSDNDLNGIIEPWEFTNATVMSSTFTGNAFTYPNSGITVDGFTFTQTQNALTTNNRTLTLGYTTNVLVNSIIKDCNLSAAVSASPFAMVLSCGGSVSNCLIEKNTVSVATSGSTDCNIQPIIGVSGGIFSNNIVRNNKANLDFSGGTSGLSNARGLILMITPSATQNTSVVSNCVIHNNEVYFKGNTNTTLTNGAIVAMHNVPASSYAYLYNCTIANNKATAISGHTASCWALRVIYAGTNTIAHNVSNNVFWNNTGTTGAVGAVTAGTQAGYGVLINNVGNGGTILNNTSPNASNLSDLANTNTGTNAPYFNNPTTTAGNLSDGTVEKSVWSINNSSSYLAAKGATIAALTSDKTGNTFSTTPARAVGAYELILAFRSTATGNWATANKWQSTRDNTTWVTATSNPSSNACPVSIQSGHTITIGSNSIAPNIIAAPGAKLTLSPGNTLTATNGITLQSSTSGTATFVDNNNTSPQAVSGIVEQHLASARNWYLSSPIAGATIPAGQTYYSYDETGSNTGFTAPATAYWVAVPEGTTINPMKGYITQPGAATTKSYTGTFNTGTKTIALTRTNSASKPGFNLVANPYPSYLDWSMVDTTAANIQTSVWYRTKTSGGAYTFDTYNGKLDVATANGENTVSKLIPPMQAFWVRVKTGFTGGTLTFDNTMRKHADVSGNKMKAPKVSETKVVRLQLSNGTNADEALVCFNSNAQNSFDSYDSPKMFESSATRPELYTLAGNEKVVINGLSDLNGLSSDMELPLGFTTGAGGNFTLKATEIASFDNSRKLYLRDKQENREIELTPETEYAFSTTAAMSNNESRFSLLFKAPGVTTGTTNANSERISVFVNTQNQITIIAKPNSKYAIYNAVGQMIENGILNSGLQTTNCKLQTGIFVVKVNNQSTRVIIK